MRCCMILILLLPQALSFMSFPLTLVVGYIVVPQGLTLFAAYGFSLVYQEARQKKSGYLKSSIIKVARPAARPKEVYEMAESRSAYYLLGTCASYRVFSFQNIFVFFLLESRKR